MKTIPGVGLRGAPLLEEPREYAPRVEVTGEDWMAMNELLAAYRRGERKVTFGGGGAYITRMLFHMNSIDASLAPKTTTQDWGSIEEDLGAARRSPLKSHLSRQLHQMRSLDPGRAPNPTEEDWTSMSEGLEQFRETSRKFSGCALEIAGHLHYMRSLDARRAPKPTEEDWRRMNSFLMSARGLHRGGDIMDILYHVEGIDGARFPEPDPLDWRDMGAELENRRSSGILSSTGLASTAMDVASALHYMRSLKEKSTAKMNVPPLPPLRRFRP